jgi:hypothetical protein
VGLAWFAGSGSGLQAKPTTQAYIGSGFWFIQLKPKPARRARVLM